MNVKVLYFNEVKLQRATSKKRESTHPFFQAGFHCIIQYVKGGEEEVNSRWQLATGNEET